MFTNRWKVIVAVGWILITLSLGIFCGLKLAGCNRAKPVNPATMEQETNALLHEVQQLLQGIERRQTERQRAAEGLR